MVSNDQSNWPYCEKSIIQILFHNILEELAETPIQEKESKFLSLIWYLQSRDSLIRNYLAPSYVIL